MELSQIRAAKTAPYLADGVNANAWEDLELCVLPANTMKECRCHHTTLSNKTTNDYKNKKREGERL
jgi:hypothetical protein